MKINKLPNFLIKLNVYSKIFACRYSLSISFLTEVWDLTNNQTKLQDLDLMSRSHWSKTEHSRPLATSHVSRRENSEEGPWEDCLFRSLSAVGSRAMLIRAAKRTRTWHMVLTILISLLLSGSPPKLRRVGTSAFSAFPREPCTGRPPTAVALSLSGESRSTAQRWCATCHAGVRSRSRGLADGRGGSGRNAYYGCGSSRVAEQFPRDDGGS